ncbi:unnamed protein product [Onchocerca flexuosa]|uniref:t-SNARE coiled-coil homology domain-containing protein n=1 Tax=Onchocerca flexuosa TaxID=387005 RepID=A0A183HJG2_9BILA|nr:unnamed protein product [Onchocerca flexuosa]
MQMKQAIIQVQNAIVDAIDHRAIDLVMNGERENVVDDINVLSIQSYI